MLEELKKEVLNANKELQTSNLVVLTWGNVSGRDSKSGLIVIKASGVEYKTMTEEDLVVVDLEGNIVEGNKHPSTDLDTHLELYKNFKNVNGIVHTHSHFAVIWAQMKEAIPCYGTTHVDYFPGPVPVTREMTKEEIEGEFERNTGKVILETFQNIDPDVMHAVLVCNHGPFVWGKSASDALHNAIVLENVAKLDYFTKIGGEEQKLGISKTLLKRHYDRKFGENAYYGQN